MEHINLERLAAFVRFSEHLNLTHTARTLGLSQPALHAQIARLSEELRVPLYIREGRALRLTREGEQVAAFGRDLLSQISAFTERLHGGASRQPVTLAAGEGALLYLLGPAIQHFTANSPGSLRLMAANAGQAIESLRLGQAQLAVVSILEVPDDITATPITSIPSALLVPAGHPLGVGDEPLALEALSGQRLIIPPPGKPHRETIAAALHAVGVRWEVGVEAGGWELMRRFVSLGLGLALVNGFCPPPEGGTRRMVSGLPHRPYVILERQGAIPSEAVQQLRQAILAHRDAWRVNAGAS